MGFFNRTRSEPVPVPHSGSMTDRVAAGANTAIDKATQVYNRNPKLIGGLALVAGALLLNGMKRGRS